MRRHKTITKRHKATTKRHGRATDHTKRHETTTKEHKNYYKEKLFQSGVLTHPLQIKSSSAEIIFFLWT